LGVKRTIKIGPLFNMPKKRVSTYFSSWLHTRTTKAIYGTQYTKLKRSQTGTTCPSEIPPLLTDTEQC
jgi:hypothetical protein